MIQLLSEIPAQIEHFRMAPWIFQQTFKTPSNQLEHFVDVFSERFSLERCALNTDEVVFEPRHLLELLSSYSIPVENQWKFILRADSGEEGKSLLLATLSDWIDFCLVTDSAQIAIYADHDEYITFYAPEDSIVSAIKLWLVEAGFERVDYFRPIFDCSQQ